MRLLGLSCGGDGDLTGEPPPDSKSDIGPKRSNCEYGGTSGEDGGGCPGRDPIPQLALLGGLAFWLQRWSGDAWVQSGSGDEMVVEHSAA